MKLYLQVWLDLCAILKLYLHINLFKADQMPEEISGIDNNLNQVAWLYNSCDDIEARTEFILVCEHASNFIPADLDELNVSEKVVNSHVGWDLGALAVAKKMAKSLNAPLVASGISRLVYDCNRPPEAPSATPAKCEVYDIIGNQNLSEAARDKRTQKYYLPFYNLLTQTIKDQTLKNNQPVIVTIHSFTGIYYGKPRDVEIGILHDDDTKFADAMLDAAKNDDKFNFERNKPYGPEDGVTHTLKLHGLENGLMNVMIEVRNDLIANQQDQAMVAETLSKYIQEALNIINKN